MPLFYIYCTVVGVSLCGIGYVLWLMKNDSDQNQIEKIAPEDLKHFDVTGKIAHPKRKLSAVTAPPAQKTNAINQTKLAPIKNQTTNQSSTRNNPFIKKFFGKKPPTDMESRLLKITPAANDPEQPEPKKSNSFMDKLSMKLTFGKKRVNPQDDIPQATKFANLTKKSKPPSNDETLSAKENINNRNEPAGTGTASLTTTHYDDAGEQNSSSAKREQESSAHLEEWKNKYEKLEALFHENSRKLAQAEDQLTNELKNREDFFKLKAILESEIKEVKDRAKELQFSLKNARMETEQQKIQAEQLKDKAADLEEAILEKNLEMDRMKKPDSTTPDSLRNDDSAKET
ncbi:MAG: hypothetical protein AB7S78_03000 [Candidatus Omnitrophota bacterium]